MMQSHLGGPKQMLIWIAAVCLATADLRGQATQQAAKPTAAQAATETASKTSLPPDGQRIVAIRIISETGEVLEENPASLALQPGLPFSSEGVRESLRQLYRTGRYADLRAETSPTAGGVRLDIVARQNFYINLVRVTGLTGLREHPSEAVALASLRLALGEAFHQSTLQEALERLRRTLNEEGLYQAQVTYELAPREATRQMDITVRVAPGPRARLRSIELHNHTELPDSAVLGRSKLKPGREVTLALLNRATERVRKLLVGKDHLGARVSLRRGTYDPKSNTLPLEFEVTTGPKVRVEVAGAKISAKTLRKLLPIYQEGSVDEDLLQEGRRGIRDYFEREGYFDVDVRYTVAEAVSQSNAGKEQPAEQVITYQVARGGRHRLAGVAFDGNKYFSDDLLRSRLHLVVAAFASRGRFSQRLLQDDVEPIRELYAANGFREVQVRGETIDDYRGKKGDLFVRFHIKEGLQTRIAELRLEGSHTLSKDDLLVVIGSTPGQPYSEFNVSGDRDNILALYYNEGFPEVRFSYTAEEIPVEPAQPGHSPGAEPVQPPRVRLIYHIVEGPQIRVARVLTGGYEHTRPNIVQREVEVKPGGPLREGEVVETQRRLYNLGIFSRVSIAPQNPAGTDREKTVVVLVEEAKRYTLAYGGGLEVQRLGGASDPVGGQVRASPRALFEIAKGNLTGRADTLSFKARASTLQGRALTSYTTQNFFGKPAFSLQVTGLADKSRDILTFTSTRFEGSVQLAQRISLLTSLLYRYSFRKVRVSSLRIPLEQIQLFNQPTRVSLVGVTWFRERRDNPADASRGDFNNMDLSIAGKPYGSSASFVRLFMQNSTFHPIYRRFLFARSARFGVQTPIGNTVSQEIPLPERFFGGGGNSLRGFGLNQAGPRDPTTGFPVGGQAMLIFNQELRFPMRLPFVGTRLGGALFYDAGNVFQNVHRITLRATPPSPSDLNYFSHTIGFGFRYGTPVGPVRVDVAYQINSPQFFVSCTLGSAGCVPLPPPSPVCVPGTPNCFGRTLARLPRFQFFFNLGAIF